jgi:thioredoxin reductase (NADPH)
MATPDSPREVDCVIVGGGAAGLSAAVNLGRMRRSVLLIDERDRFMWKHVVYNYLGFPDGIAAVDIRRLGWRQASKYGVRHTRW